MRTVIVIPARLAARRLPNKPLAVLGGLPLVARVAAQAKKCPNIDAVIVATDDPAILTAARDHGHEAILTGAHHTNGTERVAEVIARVAADRIINLQGDEPFIEPRDLETILAALEQDGVEMATLKTPIESSEELFDPNVVKVITDDRDRALYFSRAPIPYARHGIDPIIGAFAHIGVYGFRRAALERYAAAPPHPLEAHEQLEQLRALALGMTIAVRPALTRSRRIDTPDDLCRAQERIARLGEAAFPNYR